MSEKWYNPEQQVTNPKQWQPQLNQTSQQVMVSKRHKMQWGLIKWGVGIITAGIGLLTCLILEHQWKNYFRSQQAVIETAAATIQVEQNKRHDVLIKMIDNTQFAANYEKSVLENVTKMRQGQASEAEVANIQRAINVAIEAYPQLRALEQIRDLNDTIYLLEQQIKAAITNYNQQASAFNQNMMVFPKNCSAQALGLTTFRLFQVPQAHLEDVKINLTI